jgi:RNA polymerase sigma-70 factor (ECF subfamily)
MAEPGNIQDELTRFFLKGHPDALKVVYDTYALDIERRLASKFRGVLSPEDLEEILAAACFRLWQTRKRYDPSRATLGAWFYVLARSCALELLRGRRRQQAAGLLGTGAEDIAKEATWFPPQPAEDDIGYGSRTLRHGLEEILARLPLADRILLLTFAKYEGAGGWVEEASERTGLSPANVRVRKMRLVERIREELGAHRSATLGKLDREEVTLMSSKPNEERAASSELGSFSKGLNQREVQLPGWNTARLEEERNFLAETFRMLRETPLPPTQPGPGGPAEIVRRLWATAERDGSVKNPGVRKTLQRAWDWTSALLRAGAEYRIGIVSFAERCRADHRLAKATLFLDASERIAERLQLGVVGLGTAIERRTPRTIRKAKTGKFHAIWIEEGDRLDAKSYWSTDDPPDVFRLRPEATRSMRINAETPEEESEGFADRLLHAMRDRELTLPRFTVEKELDDRTVFVWHRKGVQGEETWNSPPTSDGEPSWIAPALVEAQLWDKYPPAAERLEDILLQNLWEDRSYDTDSAAPDPAMAVRHIVERLQELTGCTAEEAARLVLSLLERRAEHRCGHSSCTDYERAMAFLESQFSLQ